MSKAHTRLCSHPSPASEKPPAISEAALHRDRAVRARASWSIQERLDFYSMPEPNSGCVIWLGSVDRKGYGQIRLDYRLVYAHRLAWELKNGPIPLGALMLHRCDNPGCINPHHLRPGSPADNTADMLAKGRENFGGLELGRNGHANSPKGEHCARSKLTEAQVLSIRSDKRDCHQLARELCVHPSTIKSIRTRRTWRHI